MSSCGSFDSSIDSESKTIIGNTGFDFINIRVGNGPERSTFKVHRELLCSKVKAFDKILRNQSDEDKTKCLFLPQDDPKRFHLLVAWLYNNLIEESTGTTDYTRELIYLFVLAGKLELPNLRNKEVGLLVKRIKCTNLMLSLEDVQYVFRNTLPDSRLRTFCFKMMIALLSRTNQGPEENAQIKHTIHDLIVSVPGLAIDVMTFYHGGVEPVFGDRLSDPLELIVRMASLYND